MNAKGFILAVLFIIGGIAITIGSLALSERFSQGAHARREICQQVGNVKHILYVEHKTKLRDQQRYLAKHPEGAPSIGVTRQDILDAVAVERRIVSQTKPEDCP